MRYVLPCLIGSLFLALWGARPSFALDEIYSPNTEYKEIGLEYGGSRTVDSQGSKNNAQAHAFALEAGVLPNLTLEANGSFEKDPDSALHVTTTEIEARYQFSDPGENWLDTGFLVAYQHAVRQDDANGIEVKLLLQKDTGFVTHTANIGFSEQIGPKAVGGPDTVFLWNSRYRYSPAFQPGIELQSDLGQGQTLGRFQEQDHYLGPAAYGKFFIGNGEALKYQIGYLVGISRAAAQGAGRLLIEYETHF